MLGVGDVRASAVGQVGNRVTLANEMIDGEDEQKQKSDSEVPDGASHC